MSVPRLSATWAMPAQAPATVIGDSVPGARRLKTMNKELTSQLIVSEKFATNAGMDLYAQRSESVGVRDDAQPFNVHILNDTADTKGLV